MGWFLTKKNRIGKYRFLKTKPIETTNCFYWGYLPMWVFIVKKVVQNSFTYITYVFFFISIYSFFYFFIFFYNKKNDKTI
jgi:hypothetical protein